MSILQPEKIDIQNLQKRLSTAIGNQFQVEMEAVVEGGLPFIKERFDIVILKDGLPIAALEYKSYAYSIQVNAHPNWLIERFEKVGINYGILFFGKDDDIYLYIKGKYTLTKMSFDGLISAIRGNHAFGDKPLVDEVAVGILSCMPDELSEELDISILGALFSEDTLRFDTYSGPWSASNSSLK